MDVSEEKASDFLSRYAFLHHLPRDEQEAVFKRAQKSVPGIAIPVCVLLLFVLILWIGGGVLTFMGGLLVVWVLFLFMALITFSLMVNWVYPMLMKKDLKKRDLLPLQ